MLDVISAPGNKIFTNGLPFSSISSYWLCTFMSQYLTTFWAWSFHVASCSDLYFATYVQEVAEVYLAASKTLTQSLPGSLDAYFHFCIPYWMLWEDEYFSSLTTPLHIFVASQYSTVLWIMEPWYLLGYIAPTRSQGSPWSFISNLCSVMQITLRNMSIRSTKSYEYQLVRYGPEFFVNIFLVQPAMNWYHDACRTVRHEKRNMIFWCILARKNTEKGKRTICFHSVPSKLNTTDRLCLSLRKNTILSRHVNKFVEKRKLRL